MKHMRAVINIAMPEDEFAEAAVKVKIKPLWDTFLETLAKEDVPHTAKLETSWSRNKQARERTSGARRPRRPRGVVAVELPLDEVPTDAPGEAA